MNYFYADAAQVLLIRCKEANNKWKEEKKGVLSGEGIYSKISLKP